MGRGLSVVSICCMLFGLVVSIGINMYCSFLLFYICLWFCLFCGLVCFVLGICLGCLLFVGVEVVGVVVVALLCVLILLWFEGVDL